MAFPKSLHLIETLKYLTPVPLSQTTTFLPPLSMMFFRWDAGDQPQSFVKKDLQRPTYIWTHSVSDIFTSVATAVVWCSQKCKFTYRGTPPVCLCSHSSRVNKTTEYHPPYMGFTVGAVYTGHILRMLRLLVYQVQYSVF